MINSRISSGRRGFTLIEALSVACILAIGLFAVGAAFFGELAILSKEKSSAIATLAAQEEIENLRGMIFDDILALGPSSSFTTSGFVYLKEPAGTLTLENIYSNANIRKVTVTVSWRSIAGATLQNSLATLISRGGIDKQ
jgi:hypothetical protein